MVAHGNHQAHSHSHGEACEHSHEADAHSHGEHSHCDHGAEGHAHSHGEHSHDVASSSPAAQQPDSACCGHNHGRRDAGNPAHRALDRLYGALRLSPLAAWLEESVPATLAKIGLLALAAGAAWAAGGPAGGAALAPVWPQVASGALAGAYFFAGVPAGVQLTYDLTAGNVDTHVLMTLAALGTLLTGHALEVTFYHPLFLLHVLVVYQRGGAGVLRLSSAGRGFHPWHLCPL